ncbi:NADH-quinone oxidoreductase subunit NuoE [Microvirga puerhi]|uniref:NADH-quinone oxidoreductase subunit NuoE n=1 Tax=Microvirga puerhi TaxID=2876078 RepID=UPI0034E27F39
MAVRKLAPEDIQPDSFTFSSENMTFVAQQIAKYPQGRQASAVIPLLWRAQEQAGGWLPRKAIEKVAELLDMPQIRVMEVATFYTMFNLEPVGKYFIQLCGTTPCALRGAGDIRQVLERRVGEQNHVTEDGIFSWLEVECLGACCNAPMVQINDDYYEDLTTENFEKLLDDLAAGRPVKKGSQVGRRSSEPQGGPQTLTDPALFDGSQIGAWRKRFEEEATSAAAVQEAAAATTSAPSTPKPGKPEAGRVVETEKADTPAKRVKEGEAPVPPTERREASDKSKATAVDARTENKAEPAPHSDKSYVATPSKPEAGRPTADAPADKNNKS